MTPLDPRLVLQGYANGIFPMADSRDAEDLFWVEPRRRAILPLDGIHVSRSLRRTIGSDRFRVTLDRAFGRVVAACADRPETWINGAIEEAMADLHAAGFAHSIEVWDGDALAGGLYGVKLGRAFFGESMFSRETDASKVALAWLVARLKAGGFTLLDCQFMTPHLASLGAVEISREDYSVALAAAVAGATAASGAGGGVAPEGASAPAPATGLAGALSPDAAGPDFTALDRLLDAEDLSGAGGAGGKLIVQLLGQTS
jgi:leucyl/phenylalanyl-tRNA--protein transferase